MSIPNYVSSNKASFIPSERYDVLDSRQDSRQYWRFKFNKTKMIPRSRIGVRNTPISLINLSTVVVNTTYYTLTRLVNIVAIVKLIILYLTKAEIFDMLNTTFYISIVVGTLLLTLAFNLYMWFRAKIAENRWNESKIKKLKHGKSWMEADVSQLSVGDIIKIPRHTVIPADILLLDSSDELLSGKHALVNERKVSGINKVLQKFPIIDIRLFGEDFKTQFSGSIEYLEPGGQYDSNIGFFKLKGDPKAITIRPSHMIYAGSKLESLSVVGIILYSGRDTMIFQQNLQKSTFMSRRKFLAGSMSTLIFVISIFYLGVSIYSSFFMVLYLDNSSLTKTRNTLIEDIGLGIPSWIKYFHIFMIVSSIVPTYMIIFLEIVSFVSSILLQRRIYKMNSEHKKDLQNNSYPGYLRSMSMGGDTLQNRGGELDGFQTDRSNNRLFKQDEEFLRGDGNYDGMLDTSREISKRRSLFRKQSQEIEKKKSLESPIPAFSPEVKNEVSSPRKADRKRSIFSNMFSGLRGGTHMRKNSIAFNPKDTAQTFERQDSEGVALSAFSEKSSKKAKKGPHPSTESVFNVDPSSTLQISNYSALSELGNIDHIFFDKTDTLTEDKIDIVYFSTHKMTYLIDYDNMDLLMEDFKKSPEVHNTAQNHEEVSSQDKDYEDFYSEKSQEYEKEINREIDEDMWKEDELFLEEVVEGVKMPDFMPVKLKPGAGELLEKRSSHGEINSQGGTSFVQLEKAGSAHRPTSVSKFNSLDKNQAVESSFRMKTVMAGGKAGMGGIEKFGQYLFSNRKSTFNISSLPQQLEDDSEDSAATTYEVTDKINIIRSQYAFFYDNYSKDLAEEMKWTICGISLLLFCGMDGLKKTYSKSLLNKSLAEFLKNCGVTVKGKTGQVYSEKGYQVKIESSFEFKRTFQVYGVNPRSENKHTTSIICSTEINSEVRYFSLVRGDQQSMKNLINMCPSEQTFFRNLMVQYKELLLSRMVFGLKRITKEEVDKYLQTYTLLIASKRNDIYGIERISAPLEKGLRFFGCIGYKTNLKRETFPLLKCLKEANFKVSVLSGDSYENTINVIKETSLTSINYSDKSSYFSLDFETYEKGSLDLLNYIDIIYHSIKEKNNSIVNYYMKYFKQAEEDKSVSNSRVTFDEKYREMLKDSDFDEVVNENNANELEEVEIYKRNMVISGHTLFLIQKSEVLERYLKILLVFTNSIIGYNLNSLQKGYLAANMKKMGQRVLAVGDGLNDIAMFNEASVSIQILTTEVPLLLGDLATDQIGLLLPLLFHEGTRGLKNIRLTFIGILVVVTKLTISHIWNFVFSDFVQQLIRPYFTILIIMLFLLDGVFRTIFSNFYSKKFESNNPIIYQERQVLGRKLPLFLFLLSFSTLFELIFVHFLITYFLNKDIFQSGLIVGNLLGNSVIYVSHYLNSVYLIYLIWRSSKGWYSLVSLIIFHVVLVLSAGYVALVDNSDILRSENILEFWTQRSTVSVALFSIIVPSYINYIFMNILVPKTVNPVFSFVYYTLGIGRQWYNYVGKNHPGFSCENILKKVIFNSNIVSHNNINQMIFNVSKMLKLKKSRVEPSIMRLLLINIHQFRVGFDHIKNRIVDIQDRIRFSRSSFLSGKGILKFMLIFACLCYSSALGLKFYHWSIYTTHTYSLLYTGGTVFKVLIYLFLILSIYRINKNHDCLRLIIKYALYLVTAIDITYFALELSIIPSSERVPSWTHISIHSRLLSSAIPISFRQAIYLIFISDTLYLVELIFFNGPIPKDITYEVYKAVLILYFVGLMGFKMAVKKKYDKTCKINFLSVSKQKQEIAKSKEKLSMLMPEFVWDKINTEGFQGRFSVRQKLSLRMMPAKSRFFSAILAILTRSSRPAGKRLWISSMSSSGYLTRCARNIIFKR